MNLKLSFVLLLIYGIAFSGFAQFTPPSWENVKGDDKHVDEILLELDAVKGVGRDSMLRIFSEGYEQFLWDNHLYGQAVLLCRIGHVYMSENMFSAAEESFQEAAGLLADMDKPARLVAAFSGWGTALGRKGSYDEAAAKLMEALRIAEKMDDPSVLSSIYLKLGTVNTYISNFPKGLEYFEKALNLALQYDKTDVITLYGNIGYVYMAMKDFSKSEEYFKSAIAYQEANPSEKPQTLPYLNLGQLYILSGRPALATEYLDRAQQMAEEKNQIEELMAIALVREDRSTPAAMAASLQTFETLEKKATELELNYMRMEILNHMIDLGKALGRYKETVAWMEECRKVEKQLFTERKEKDIANLQAAYELNKSKEELRDLSGRMEVERKVRRLYLLFALLLGGGMFLSLYFYERSRKVNKLLKQRERELSESLQVRDRLFSIIGHDLKNAISSQPVVLELMKDTQEPEERQALLEGLETSIYDVLYVLDTLLNWGRMQFQGVHVRPSRLDVQELCVNTVRLLQLAAKLKELEIRVQIPANVQVYADPEQFKFIIRNLISNAIKYSRRGGLILVEIVPEQQHHKGADLQVFAVRDFGVGMSEEQIQHLFQMDTESLPGTSNEVGHGIALFISREFVQKNGGQIWVESVMDKGSAFYFSLPRPKDPRVAPVGKRPVDSDFSVLAEK